MAQNTLTYRNYRGSKPISTMNLPIGTGQVLVQGQVAAYDTGAETVIAYDSNAGGDAAVFFAIVNHDANQVTGATYVSVDVYGEVFENYVIFANPSFDTEVTQAMKIKARSLGIIFKKANV